MKNIVIKTCLLGIVTFTSANGQAIFQSAAIQGHELSLFKVAFDSSKCEVYTIPLRAYGLKKNNYSVLVKVRFTGDTSFYRLPGKLPSGDSFSLRHRAGKKGQGDTLCIIRQTGEKRLVFEEVKIMALRGQNKSGLLSYNRAFTKFLLTGYLRDRPLLFHPTASYFVTSR